MNAPQWKTPLEQERGCGLRWVTAEEIGHRPTPADVLRWLQENALLDEFMRLATGSAS